MDEAEQCVRNGVVTCQFAERYFLAMISIGIEPQEFGAQRERERERAFLAPLAPPPPLDQVETASCLSYCLLDAG